MHSGETPVTPSAQPENPAERGGPQPLRLAWVAAALIRVALGAACSLLIGFSSSHLAMLAAGAARQIGKAAETAGPSLAYG